MKIFFLPLLLFSFNSCGNETPEKSATAENTTVVQISAPASSMRSTFKANVVNELSKFINYIFEDKKGNIWIASNDNGVYCFDRTNLFHFTTKDGLSDDQVYAIQEDSGNNIWFSCAGGISRFDGKSISKLPAIYDKKIYSGNNLKPTANDNWFSFSGGGYQYDGSAFGYILLPTPSGEKEKNPTDPNAPEHRIANSYTVYCSLKDKKGNVWFGTQAMGVCRYDGKTFTWFTEKGLKGPAVRSIFEDSKGNLWFGNNGGGLFKYDGISLRNITEENGLGNPEFLEKGKSGAGTIARVWSVNEDKNQNIWIGTIDAGLWRYDGKRFTNFSSKDGLTSDAVTTICVDNSGQLWIGTGGGGICKFNGNGFSTLTFN